MMKTMFGAARVAEAPAATTHNNGTAIFMGAWKGKIRLGGRRNDGGAESVRWLGFGLLSRCGRTRWGSGRGAVLLHRKFPRFAKRDYPSGANVASRENLEFRPLRGLAPTVRNRLARPAIGGERECVPAADQLVPLVAVWLETK